MNPTFSAIVEMVGLEANVLEKKPLFRHFSGMGRVTRSHP